MGFYGTQGYKIYPELFHLCKITDALDFWDGFAEMMWGLGFKIAVSEMRDQHMKKITDIAFRGTSGFTSIESAYEEILTISSESISYEYKPVRENEHNYTQSWTCQAKSPMFQENYESLCGKIQKVMEHVEDIFCPDTGTLTVTVTLEDGSNWEKYYTFTVKEFEDSISTIEKMIPSSEVRPRFMDQIL